MTGLLERRHSAKPVDIDAQPWTGPKRPYDLVKEFTIALVVVAVLTAALAAGSATAQQSAPLPVPVEQPEVVRQYTPLSAERLEQMVPKHPGYLGALQRYRQVLAQRNSVLRRGGGPEQVGAWDEGLVGWGSRVIAARARWIGERADSFAAHVVDISDGASGALEYEPSIAAERASDGGGEGRGSEAVLDEIAERFRCELARSGEREERRGMTLVGPHRDDLRLRGEVGEGGGAGSWVDLRTYGSGGQQRTAAVALRMIEAESLRETAGREPVILLDDVFAELDPGRSRRILRWIEQEEGGQVILTAPKPADVEVRGGSLPRWTIRGGVVESL